LNGITSSRRNNVGVDADALKDRSAPIALKKLALLRA
jgi:hypothetical protein